MKDLMKKVWLLVYICIHTRTHTHFFSSEVWKLYAVKLMDNRDSSLGNFRSLTCDEHNYFYFYFTEVNSWGHRGLQRPSAADARTNMKIWHINKANFSSEVKRLYQHVTIPQVCSLVKSAFRKMSYFMKFILYISYAIKLSREIRQRVSIKSALGDVAGEQLNSYWFQSKSVWNKIYMEIKLSCLDFKQATLAAKPGSCCSFKGSF